MNKASHSKFIATGILPDWFQDQFARKFGARVHVVSDHLREELLESLNSEVVALIARGSTFIDGQIMSLAPNLKVIARTGVGYDSVDIDAATRRGIPVTYTPGAMSAAVAEHTLMLLLACVKQLPLWQHAFSSGDWEARYRNTSLDLEDSTVGIVGYGRIGRRVRRLLRCFQTKVVVNDPYLHPDDFAGDDIRFVPLDELLSTSDVITLHVPLTEETRNLIHSENLDCIKQGAILINTARGPVVESLDLLLHALDSSRLGGVGLDVFVSEPPDPNHPLFRHHGVISTGHVAARSIAAQRNILRTTLAEIERVFSGERPSAENTVNPEVFSGPAG